MFNVDTLLKIAEARGFDVDWSGDYAEPGYTAGEEGIVLANWNNVTRYDRESNKQILLDDTPDRMLKMFECAGCQIEWSDEWASCDDCGKIVRTSADGYGWAPAYAWIGDCSIVCAECLEADPDDLIEQLQDNPNQADTMGIVHALDGWHEVSTNNETGLHPGQNARPADILDSLHALGITRVVFSVDSVGQFDATWSAWAHEDNIPDSAWNKLSGYDG